MTYWAGKSVLVTGGTGFIGSHLVEALLERNAHVRVAGRDREHLRAVLGRREGEIEFLQGDLTSPVFARQACAGMEAVFNLAAQVAGVEYNNSHPGTTFTSNVAIGLNVLDASAEEGVERLLYVSSACVYRRHCTVPTPELEGFQGDPEFTNFGYGWAKRALEIQARCYAQEFPIKIGIVRPYNAYGPRDNFEWETSHVIPSLIRKAVEGQDPIVVWGDGTQLRSFVYVSDFVKGLLLALERYPECDPVNIGTDEEVTIADLVRMIVELVGTKARIVFATDRPAGQPRRKGDLSKAREKLGFECKVSLEGGLLKTIEWYTKGRR
ncbi:SDR family NAD(P)-dependent oxidoreductase [Acidobacteria bacterium AH-259-D05]|nr:SDR family NAD(P)-dependent oxidoreductase [Acidobacteria bacterium AH-259-D05]